MEAVAPRHVPVAGAANLRDLGGYSTVGGGHVRWRHVYRSDALDGLSADDLGIVGGLGLRTVFDLRREVERARWPSVDLGGAIRLELLPIGGEAGEQREITQRILDGEIEQIDLAFMTGVYERMLVEAAPTFARLLTGLADADALPALFHCTAGKDRTGVAAALLLDVLGVPEEHVLDDYELTGSHWSELRIAEVRGRFEAAGIDLERHVMLFAAPRGAMAAALAGVRAAHGSGERHLVEVGGMDPGVGPALRARLVAPA